MFNNINENSLLDSQLNTNNVININSVRSNFQKSGYVKNPYIDKTEISSDAMKLFQKDLDIKKFTKFIVDEKDDISYMEKINELFNDGVVDPFDENAINKLLSNNKLLDDLGL